MKKWKEDEAVSMGWRSWKAAPGICVGFYLYNKKGKYIYLENTEIAALYKLAFPEGEDVEGEVLIVCGDCRYYKRCWGASNGFCRRYPKLRGVFERYGCGEWKPK